MDSCNSVCLSGRVIKERNAVRGYLVLQGEGFRAKVLTDQDIPCGTCIKVQGRLSTYEWYIPVKTGRIQASALSITAVSIQKEEQLCL